MTMIQSLPLRFSALLHPEFSWGTDGTAMYVTLETEEEATGVNTALKKADYFQKNDVLQIASQNSAGTLTEPFQPTISVRKVDIEQAKKESVWLESGDRVIVYSDQAKRAFWQELTQKMFTLKPDTCYALGFFKKVLQPSLGFKTP
jgi:hypothetical protein